MWCASCGDRVCVCLVSVVGVDDVGVRSTRTARHVRRSTRPLSPFLWLPRFSVSVSLTVAWLHPYLPIVTTVAALQQLLQQQRVWLL